MSVVLGLIVIVRKMDTEYYKVESIFLHSTEPVNCTYYQLNDILFKLRRR
jgi:hypothetical protein